MGRFWQKHMHLIGYLMIVLVAVVAIEIHHGWTTKQIREARRVSCSNAEIISSNQRLVLDRLIALLEENGQPVDDLREAKQRIPVLICAGKQ